MTFKAIDIAKGKLDIKLAFYKEVVEKGSATISMRNYHDHSDIQEIVCTAVDSDKHAMPQYQIYGCGGFAKLLADTGEFSVRWDKHFKGKLFTFKQAK
ncbi:MAG: hypothetical protein KTR16_12660 [Acidiferrobacterales bacterium]|nr:hypothetical protein [Acidiferrobacterales bacterium]